MIILTEGNTVSKKLPRYKIVVRKTAAGGASTEFTTGTNCEGNAIDALKEFQSHLRDNEKVVGVYYLMADEKHCTDIMAMENA